MRECTGELDDELGDDSIDTFGSMASGERGCSLVVNVSKSFLRVPGVNFENDAAMMGGCGKIGATAN